MAIKLKYQLVAAYFATQPRDPLLGNGPRSRNPQQYKHRSGARLQYHTKACLSATTNQPTKMVLNTTLIKSHHVPFLLLGRCVVLWWYSVLILLKSEVTSEKGKGSQ